MRKTLSAIALLGALFLGTAAPLSAQDRTSQLYILGGELSNSAATSTADIDEAMPRMKAIGLNTVLVPAYWDLTEPTEGRFDFSLIDRTLFQARQNHLKVVFLWFGAWKNSMSCYAPLWFKENTKKYPRAMTRTGKPLEIASAFSEEVFQADCRAFTRFMQHLAEKDKGIGTVSMIQIENEIGMLEDARDHSPLAEKAYRGKVPAELLKAMGKQAAGQTWAEAFGTDEHADEIFMAWHYARYVERLARVARTVYDMPLYVNAAMNSRGRKPGEYPSAGPLAHLATVWKCGAPTVDMLSPDIYDTGFKSWAAQYALPGNRLFIPESRCCEDSGVRALYVMGEYQAAGFSPFAIDQAQPSETRALSRAYHLLSQMQPYLSKSSARRKPYKSWGILFDQNDRQRIIADGDLLLICRHYFTLPWDKRATDGTPWPEGGAAIVKIAPGEYLIAGSGVVVEFKTKTEHLQAQPHPLGQDGFTLGGKPAATESAVGSHKAHSFTGKRSGIGYVDQVSILADGTLQYLRRDNGDQDHQGRHARIGARDWRILHVKLYEY